MVLTKDNAANHAVKGTPISVRDVAAGYLEALLFTDGGPDAPAYEETTFSSDARKKALADCEAFLAKLSNEQVSLLESLGSAYTATSLGHDFWFTRNGHGVGFWDRDVLTKTSRVLSNGLSDIARDFGSADSYIGDDGLIHLNREPATQAEEIFVVLVARAYEENGVLNNRVTAYPTKELAKGAALALRASIKDETPDYVIELGEDGLTWYLVDPESDAVMVTIQVISTRMAQG